MWVSLFQLIFEWGCSYWGPNPLVCDLIAYSFVPIWLVYNTTSWKSVLGKDFKKCLWVQLWFWNLYVANYQYLEMLCCQIFVPAISRLWGSVQQMAWLNSQLYPETMKESVSEKGSSCSVESWLADKEGEKKGSAETKGRMFNLGVKGKLVEWKEWGGFMWMNLLENSRCKQRLVEVDINILQSREKCVGWGCTVWYGWIGVSFESGDDCIFQFSSGELWRMMKSDNNMLWANATSRAFLVLEAGGWPGGQKLWRQ